MALCAKPLALQGRPLSPPPPLLAGIPGPPSPGSPTVKNKKSSVPVGGRGAAGAELDVGGDWSLPHTGLKAAGEDGPSHASAGFLGARRGRTVGGTGGLPWDEDLLGAGTYS